jgi:tetratricopeptide (TPR) repeat protein
MVRMRQKIGIFVMGCALVVGVAPGCRRSPQSRETAALKRGQQLMAKGDYARAQLEFRNAAQAMPKDAEPYYQLGLAYLGSSNLAGAVAALRRATELNPKHQGAQLKLAELMTASRNKDLIEQAAAKLREMVAAGPENLDAIDTLAAAEFQMGQTEQAENRLESLLEKFPAHLKSSIVLAQLRLGQRDLDGAEAVLTKAVANAPQAPQAALALGQLYLIRRRFDQAESEIRRALALDSKNPDVLLSLAALQLAQRKFDDAEQTYQKLSTLPDPRFRPLHAAFLYQIGKKEAALAEFQKQAAAAPNDLAARNRLIAVYMDLNRISEAEGLLAAALRRNPKDTDALLARSRVYGKVGKPAAAAQDLRQVLQLRPDSAEAHYLLADVYRAQGLDALARQELDTALHLKAELLPARLALAGDYLRAGQPQSALSLLEAAPPSQKQTPTVVLMRNWVLLALGDFQQVRSIVEQALRQRRLPDLLLQDAVIKIQAQDYAGARLDAEEILRNNPADARAAQIVAETYVDQKQPAKALQRLTEIAEVQPKSAELQYLLGQWQMNAGKLAEAQKAFALAKAANPLFFAADLSLAEIDRRQNRQDLARQRLMAVIHASPNHVPALLALAAIEDAAGHQVEAVAHYRSVLAVDGSNLVALNNLSYLLAPQNPDEALQFAQQALEKAPDNPFVQDTMGWVYYRKGLYSTAVTYLKTAVAKDPTPLHQFHLAMSYLKSGERDRGQRMLQSALQADPNLLKTEKAWR